LIIGGWDGSSFVHTKVDLVDLNTGELCPFYPLPEAAVPADSTLLLKASSLMERLLHAMSKTNVFHGMAMQGSRMIHQIFRFKYPDKRQ
jgi:hypothetical protein